jgi:hypothetical protein
MAAPRTQLCSPWITSADVASLPPVAKALEKFADREQGMTLCGQAADGASRILYELSGRRFPGVCGPVTIRPVSRPVDADTRGWVNRGWSYGGIGSASMMTLGMPPVVSGYGENDPPVITIYDYPVNEIVSVYIDGVLIPTDEYEVRNFRDLVRMRTTGNSSPTERWGWPTSQVEDLPDTEPGTFSVTYTYGMVPDYGGIIAAKKLAEVFALPQLGDVSRYPERLASISRQGVSASVANPMDLLQKGMTGIYEVDLWLKSINPNGNRRQAMVWSPDRAPNRRQPTVTN